jgi:hypothetical protein
MPTAQDEPVRYDEVYAELLFVEPPTVDFDSIIAAWTRWGYTCEEGSPREGWRLFFKGGAAVLIGEVGTLNQDNFPDDYPITATVVDRDTYLIDHNLSFEAFKTCRYSLPIAVRVMKEEGIPTLLNELVISLAGIRQALQADCIWLDHASMFVGTEDFDEYSNYLNITEEAPQITNPDPLYFGIHFSSTSPVVEGYTRGIERFAGYELAICLTDANPIEAAGALLDTGRYAISGATFEPGETMEYRNRTYRFIEQRATAVDTRRYLKLTQLR